MLLQRLAGGKPRRVDQGLRGRAGKGEIPKETRMTSKKKNWWRKCQRQAKPGKGTVIREGKRKVPAGKEQEKKEEGEM